MQSYLFIGTRIFNNRAGVGLIVVVADRRAESQNALSGTHFRIYCVT